MKKPKANMMQEAFSGKNGTNTNIFIFFISIVSILHQSIIYNLLFYILIPSPKP
jgi:hypothetical protein